MLPSQPPVSEQTVPSANGLLLFRWPQSLPQLPLVPTTQAPAHAPFRVLF